MNAWRSAIFDLRLLSNGVLLYPIFYAMGFLAYFTQLGDSGDKNIILAIPLLSLSLCVLTHIANEKADKVAEVIVLQHGGYRRRLGVRMVSIFSYNSILILFAYLVVGANSGALFDKAPALPFTALLVNLVFSTAGVIVAAALPHPLSSVAITMALLFAGGLAPTDSYQASDIIAMLASRSFTEWFSHAMPFTALWLGAAAIAWPFALGRHLRRLTPRTPQTRRVAVPGWVGRRVNFLNLTWLSFTTNWLGPLSLLISLTIYSYSTLVVAAKYGILGVAEAPFSMFPSLVLMNVVPAILLTRSLQRTEVEEQETLLFKSKGQRLRAAFAQTASVITVGSVLLLLGIAQLAHADVTSRIAARGLLVTVVVAPGLTSMALLLGSKIRSAPILALLSFLMTFPELAVSKLLPQLSPWLPSSIISNLCGGTGPLTQAANLPLQAALAITFLAVLAPCTWIFTYDLRTKIRRERRVNF